MCRSVGQPAGFVVLDLEELVRNSQRVIVLRDRRKVGELGPDQISEANIMQAIAAQFPAKKVTIHLGPGTFETKGYPNTGGWQNWQTVTVPANLTAGPKVLRLSMEGGGFNLNWFELAAKAFARTSMRSSRSAVRLIVPSRPRSRSTCAYSWAYENRRRRK